MFFACITILHANSARAQSTDPPSFTCTDVGSSYGSSSSGGTITAGVDSYNATTGVLTMNGMGFGPKGINVAYVGPEDQFHFTYATVNAGSNFRLIAEVTSVTPASGQPAGGTTPVVGVMVRAGTANANDEGCAVYGPLGNTTNNTPAAYDFFGIYSVDTEPAVYQPVDDGIAAGVGGGVSPPFWLEVVKIGTELAFLKSPDGLNWVPIANTGGVPYQAAGQIDVGFCLSGGAILSGTSWTDDPTVSATISNISLNTNPVQPYEASWIGDTDTTFSTGWAASSLNAMWVDNSGNCFVNGDGFENIGFPYEYSDGKIAMMYDDDFQYWGNNGYSGYGAAGSITGDNNGNIYLYGEVPGTAGEVPGFFKAAVNGQSEPITLNTTTPVTAAGGMAWDPNNDYLYVSDAEASSGEILALNPAQSGSSQEVTTADFPFATSYPGPMTVDGSGRLWIISDGDQPGTGDYQPCGAPFTLYPAGVYCYTPTSTGATQASIKIGNVIDTTKVYQSQPISGASDQSPIVITTVSDIGLQTGNSVTISGVEGNTAANGTFTITVLTPTTFSLNGTTGNGAYTFGGSVSTPSGLSVGWNPTAICYDSATNQLLITDNGPDQDIKVFNLTGWNSGTKTSPSSSYGAVGGLFAGTTPGLLTDSSGKSNRFYGPMGVGVDNSGNIYVAENYNASKYNQMGDVRSLTFTTAGTLNWDLSGLTWLNVGDFDPETGDQYTVNQHYRMNYANGSGSEWSQYSFLWDPFAYAVEPETGYSEAGMRTRRINGSLFLFAEAGGNQIDIYRMNGEQMVPCGSVIGTTDYETGVWCDTNADGVQETNEVGPSAYLPYSGWDVDSAGDIWLVNAGTGASQPATVSEIYLQSVTSGVPIYSLASTSDYATWNLPAPFTNAVWQDPEVRYIASSDTLYVMGSTYEFPTTDSEQATILRINNFPSSPTVAWTYTAPVPDLTPIDFPIGYGFFLYKPLDVENDKVFFAEEWGPVHVLDANTGAPVTELYQGPDADGSQGYEDLFNLGGWYDPSDNEYVVAEENSGDSGRQNLFRWSPFSGSPAVKSFTITGATDASPIVVTTSTAHGLVTGQTVVINGVLGNTAANGTWIVTKSSSTKVTLTTNYITNAASSGNGTYKSGTGTLIYGGVPGDQDFDSPSKAGGASQTAGTYTVNGGGAGYALSGGVDQVNLCWTQMDGNGSIAAQVTGLSGSSAAMASAGVMIRNAISAAGGDPEVSLVVTQSDGLIFQYRSTASGATTTVATKTGITPSSDEFVMLVRSTTNSAGDTFSAYYSASGVSWTQLGSPVVFTTPMNLTAYTGLAVTAASSSSLATGTFDRELLGHTQIVTPAAPANLSAQSYMTGVVLGWSYVTGALQYNVYRGTTSGGETLLASGVTNLQYTDTSAVNGDTYYYEVTAVGTGGESGRSNEQEITFQNWNPDFAWPVNFGGTNYVVAPASDAWTYGNSEAGVCLPGSNADTATIPDGGTQTGFLWYVGTISQTLTGFVSNTTYTVTFWAAEANDGYAPDTIDVTMDGTPVSLTQVGVGPVSQPITPPSTSEFTEYQFTYVTGSSDPGSHTLEFAGTGASAGTNVDIDDIAFSPGL